MDLLPQLHAVRHLRSIRLSQRPQDVPDSLARRITRPDIGSLLCGVSRGEPAALERRKSDIDVRSRRPGVGEAQE